MQEWKINHADTIHHLSRRHIPYEVRKQRRETIMKRTEWRGTDGIHYIVNEIEDCDPQWIKDDFDAMAAPQGNPEAEQEIDYKGRKLS